MTAPLSAVVVELAPGVTAWRVGRDRGGEVRPVLRVQLARPSGCGVHVADVAAAGLPAGTRLEVWGVGETHHEGQ